MECFGASERECTRGLILIVVRLLVGAKCDLENERKVTVELAQQKAKQWGCTGYIETSAKNGIRHQEAFEELARGMMKMTAAAPKENKPGKKRKCSIL